MIIKKLLWVLFSILLTSVWILGSAIYARTEPLKYRNSAYSVALADSPQITKADPTYTSSTLGAKFVLIPAGTFIMGGSGGNEKHHRVTISKSFYMQTTEVTQGQWQKVMESNPSIFTDCGDDCPVERVSWDDVQEFIRKLNAIEGTDRYRLPTEAEWEYAARSGGEQTVYAGTSNESDLGEYAWYKINMGISNHPVGQKKPNSLGLYDMSGNVWEWVQDWYGDYPSGSVTDPKGPSSGLFRVNRGGSRYDKAGYCRVTLRYYGTPALRYSNLGFRLVRTPY